MFCNFAFQVRILNNEQIPVMMYEDFSLLIQKIDLKVEESLIWSALEYANLFAVSSEAGKKVNVDKLVVVKRAKDFVDVPELLLAPEPFLYFKSLTLQPVAINLSFRSQASKHAGQHTEVSAPDTWIR